MEEKTRAGGKNLVWTRARRKTAPLFVVWWSAVKYDLQRTFWVMAAKDDGRHDAVHPSAFDQRENARFVAFEPAVLAF
jgi:hypothetical protein